MNKRSMFGIFCSAAVLSVTSSFAALPKSADLVAKMGMGFNIGNTMEVPENPT
ncbi:MAG: glycoside hydrolase family 5 protein, partial [Fibrobacteraceae bacterium]|nr:glycoside hydrolase family 5 protein [Fibrobacteraceae bacterium]